MRPILQALFACVLAAPAVAQVDALVLGTKPPTQYNCYFEDVVDKIRANGPFDDVDWLNVRQTTPTLAELQAYDCVIVFASVNRFLDSNALGDNLADYVDAGGGVVVAMSACAHIQFRLTGRWLQGYQVIPPQTLVMEFGQESLGVIEQPNHPVMENVNTFLGGLFALSGSLRPSTNVVMPGSSVIARWTDGAVLIAEGTTPRRIDLGFLPPSSGCVPSFWDENTDGGVMMANALMYVAGLSTPIGNTVCTPAVANSTGQPGEMRVFGSEVALDNELFLAGFDLPSGQFAYFIASRTPGFIVGPGTSMGNLCVVSQIARFASQLGPIANGIFSIDVDLTSVPEPPNGNHAVIAGETWYWQCWYRDVFFGNTTSNFTDSVELLFQ